VKVLHLIGGEDFGGAKSHVISLVSELQKKIDVKIITFRKGAFSSDAEKLGINIEVVKSKSFIGDIRKLIQIIKKENISLVHSHGAKANMFGLIAKFFTKVPVVTTVHSDYKLDYMDSNLKKYSFGLINAVALRLIDYHIGVSDNFKKMLIKRRFNPEKIFKLYNGIKFDFHDYQYSRGDFLKRFKISIPENAVIVGILARLHPVKGIHIFLDAAGIIAKKHPNAYFLIGGDGDERKLLEDKARKLGILQKTYFIGYVDDPYEFMECIDINTLTSLSESFPYVILEGANQRKTVVSSNVGGISDLITNGENGFLFEPGDYKKMAQFVNTLIEDELLRESLGQKLYLDAKEGFSLDSMRQTQLKIYEDIFKKMDIKKSSKHKYDIILSGYYGFDNLGDDAMLMGIINSLKEFNPHLRMLILSKKPVQTRLKTGHNTINRINLFSILHYMEKSQLFINGGGNLIQDTTSTRSLMYYLGTILIAKVLGMKVMIYGNGIGPLNKKFNQKISSFVLNKIDAITLREKISLDVLRDIGVTVPLIELTADPALTMDSKINRPQKNILFEYGIPNGENLIGYSIRNCRGDKNSIRALSKIADYLTEKYQTVPIFIPMHPQNDVKTAKIIARRMKNKAYVITEKFEVNDILHLISKLQLLIGMRLHSLIFALKLDIPVIGISYEPKVEGFLEMIGQDSSINIQNIDYHSFIQKADEIWINRSEIKNELKEKNKWITSLSKKNAEFANILLNEIGGPNNEN
jgi:polysaccharide pyruvyl transferase CsaB